MFYASIHSKRKNSLSFNSAIIQLFSLLYFRLIMQNLLQTALLTLFSNMLFKKKSLQLHDLHTVVQILFGRQTFVRLQNVWMHNFSYREILVSNVLRGGYHTQMHNTCKHYTKKNQTTQHSQKLTLIFYIQYSNIFPDLIFQFSMQLCYNISLLNHHHPHQQEQH